MKKLVLIVTAAALAFSTVSAFAADGAPARCISLMQINASPIIDDHTILLKLNNGDYKRIDLRGTCKNISWDGYVRSSPENNFCATDILHVLGPTPSSCQIEKIVTIDEAEAKSLEASKK